MTYSLIALNMLVFAGVIITCVLYTDLTLRSYHHFFMYMLGVYSYAKLMKLETSYLPVLIFVVYTIIAPILIAGEKAYNRNKSDGADK